MGKDEENRSCNSCSTNQYTATTFNDYVEFVILFFLKYIDTNLRYQLFFFFLFPLILKITIRYHVEWKYGNEHSRFENG